MVLSSLTGCSIEILEYIRSIVQFNAQAIALLFVQEHFRVIQLVVVLVLDWRRQHFVDFGCIADK